MGMGASLTALVLLGALASGCGDDGADSKPMSKGEYYEAATRLFYDQHPTNELVSELTSELPRKRCEQAMRAFQDEVRRRSDAVADLDPPERIADLQADLVAAANEFADRVGEISDEVGAGTRSCGPEMGDRLSGLPSARRGEEMISRLVTLGYVGGR